MKTSAFSETAFATRNSLAVSASKPGGLVEIIHLPKRNAGAIDLAEDEQVRLVLESGTAWVTLEGDAEDHMLVKEDRARFSGPGRLVIESLEGELLIRATRSHL